MFGWSVATGHNSLTEHHVTNTQSPYANIALLTWKHIHEHKSIGTGPTHV
jgi:hypothetical protein